MDGLTPKGPMTLSPGPGRLWAIGDSYGTAAGLLRALADAWQEAGCQVVLVMDPLDPDAVAGVLLPEKSLGWLRTNQIFPGPRQALLRLDLDGALEEGLSPLQMDRMAVLRELEARLVREATGWLTQAKAHHDMLEELCRPAVDFAGVQRETELLCRDLFTES